MTIRRPRMRWAAIVACAIATMSASRRVQAQDAAAGKVVFAQCSVCHAADSTNGQGPSLRGVVGRKAGSVSGFLYSRAMKHADIIWDEQKLDGYLADPQHVVPGNVMPFSGIADATQRANLIAYLKTLK